MEHEPEGYSANNVPNTLASRMAAAYSLKLSSVFTDETPPTVESGMSLPDAQNIIETSEGTPA